MGPDGSTDFGAIGPVVEYNSAYNRYLVVWWGDDNAGSLVNDEYEIYGQQVSAATGAEIGVDTRLSDMGPDGSADYTARTPAATYNGTNNQYLIVWRGEDNTPPLVNDEAEIFGQRFDGNFLLSLPFIRQ